MIILIYSIYFIKNYLKFIMYCIELSQIPYALWTHRRFSVIIFLRRTLNMKNIMNPISKNKISFTIRKWLIGEDNEDLPVSIYFAIHVSCKHHLFWLFLMRNVPPWHIIMRKVGWCLVSIHMYVVPGMRSWGVC